MQALNLNIPIRSLLLGACLLLCANSLSAQTFNGFQSPFGNNTFFFSIAWQGEVLIGTGYIKRLSGSTFTDLQTEIRFPLKDMYKLDNYELIAGMYKPLAIKRAFLGTGVHLRLERKTDGDQKSTLLSLALTALPTYTYASSTTDGVYGTAALRVTYAPVVFAHTTDSGDQFFSAHKIELGGHLDALIERSLGLTLNGIMQRSFFPANSILAQDKTWEMEGDFYMGASYWLERN